MSVKPVYTMGTDPWHRAAEDGRSGPSHDQWQKDQSFTVTLDTNPGGFTASTEQVT